MFGFISRIHNKRKAFISIIQENGLMAKSQLFSNIKNALFDIVINCQIDEFFKTSKSLFACRVKRLITLEGKYYF